MKPKDPDARNYFAALADDRRSKLIELHETIVSLFPDIHLDMAYKMPTYRQDDGWVAIANQKNYVSLYTCGYHHIEAFKRKHPDIKTAKGCINFKDSDNLPLADIKEVIRHAIEHPKQLTR